MKCPNCSATVADGSKFCGNCGYKIGKDNPPKDEAPASAPAVLSFCPNCGNTMIQDKTHCDNCGIKLHDAGARIQGGQTQPERSVPKTRIMSVVLCAALSLLLGGGLFWATRIIPEGSDKTPETQQIAENNMPHELPDLNAAEQEPTTSLPEPGSTAEPSTAEGSIDASVTETPMELTARLVIDPEWDAINGGFDEFGRARVAKGEDWHLIDRSGYVLTSRKYDEIRFFMDGMAVVKRDGEFGYIDTDGNEVISPTYEEAFGFCDGIARFSDNGKFGYIDRDGNILVEPVFDSAKAVSEGYALVSAQGSSKYYYFYIDYFTPEPSTVNSGNLYYQDAMPFAEGLAAVKYNNKWGYIDADLDFVIMPEFDMAYDFIDGAAIVQKNGLQYHIDTNGNRISPKCDQVWNYSDGYATSMLDGKYGFIDRETGDFAIFPEYDAVWAFGNGLAPVSVRNGIWYYINKNNMRQFGTKRWDEAHKFNGGVAKVKASGKWGFINTKGEEIIPAMWDDAHLCLEMMVGVCRDGKWGFYAIEHEQIQ